MPISFRPWTHVRGLLIACGKTARLARSAALSIVFAARMKWRIQFALCVLLATATATAWAQQAGQRVEIVDENHVLAEISYTGGRFVVIRRQPVSRPQIASQSSEGCLVALKGVINKQAVSAFDEVVRKVTNSSCSDTWLLLESPGGLVFEGLDLGVKVRAAGFRTYAGIICASACAFAFLGGTDRLLLAGARIGLHQVTIERRTLGGAVYRYCDPTSYGPSARAMSEYLKTMIPANADQVLDLIMQTPCESITWVTGQRALDLGIATTLK